MTGRFYFNNVKIKKHDEEKWLMLKGEVTNASGKSYSAVSFRAVLFARTMPVANIAFVINGLRLGQTRIFEVQIGELEFAKIGKEITKFDLYAESGY